MDKRYRQFNEVTFEAYIKSAIDKSVLKARLKESARGELEQTFSSLPEAILRALTTEEIMVERTEMDCQMFEMRGIQIPVQDYNLGQALSYLMPLDREIILHYFFVGLNDRKIGKVMGISRATVQRHRKEALMNLQILLRNNGKDTRCNRSKPLNDKY